MLTIVIVGDNMTKKITSMQISEQTLDILHNLKSRGDTYEDVIIMLLQNYDESITFDNVK